MSPQQHLASGMRLPAPSRLLPWVPVPIHTTRWVRTEQERYKHQSISSAVNAVPRVLNSNLPLGKPARSLLFSSADHGCVNSSP